MADSTVSMVEAPDLNDVQMADAFELNNFLPYKCALLASIVSDTFARQYTQNFGISVHEWRTIAHLNQNQLLSVRDISDRANIDRATVTRAVARLEAKGIVAKVPNQRDKRLVELSLTEEGRQLYLAIVPVAMAFEKSLVDSCRSEGFDDPHALLDLLIDNVRAFNENM